MIIKDYFADGLLQIAIVLSLVRSDLDSFLDTSARPVLVGHYLSETTDGPLSGITRTDLNFNSGRFSREYPKVLDSYNDRFSAVLRDLHSLSYYRRFSGISTNVHAWLVNDGRPEEPLTSSRVDDTADSAEETNTVSHDVSSLSTAAEDSSAVVPEASNLMLSFEDELSKEVDYVLNVCVTLVL